MLLGQDQNLGQGLLLLAHPSAPCVALLHTSGFQMRPSWVLEVSVEDKASQGPEPRKCGFPCPL